MCDILMCVYFLAYLAPRRGLAKTGSGEGGEKLLINAYLWNYRLMLPSLWLTD